MLLEPLGQFLARLRANPAKWIRVLRTALEHLARQGRDPRAIPCRHDHCRHDVNVGLREPLRHHSLTAPPRHITSIDCIAEFWRPHNLFPRIIVSLTRSPRRLPSSRENFPSARKILLIRGPRL